MANIVVATFEAGGNAFQCLGIAREAVRRGHRVTVLASPAERAPAEALGAAFIEFGERLDQDDIMSSFLRAIASPRSATCFAATVTDLDADVVLVDMDLASCVEADTGVPTVVLVPTIYHAFVPTWRAVIDAANEIRAADGLEPLTRPDLVWASKDRTIATTIATLDRDGEAPHNLRYVGPVTNPDATGEGWRPPSDRDGRPLVLASYSSVSADNPPERLQTVLDALAELPVRTVATTGRIYPASLLQPPANAIAVDYIPHWEVMQYVSVCISHAGHGTTSEALRHGVPVVCVPGIGLDQAWIAKRVAQLGIGIAVRDSSSGSAIRDAVERILADATYTENALAFAPQLQVDGASGAVNVLEELLSLGP